MDNLYEKHAAVYDAMYKTFIDYEAEFKLYNELFSAINPKSVLELACGTGNMAPLFINNQINYTGVDLNRGMLNIAKSKNPESDFIEADMRAFKVKDPVEAVLLMSRSTSYLISNNDFVEMLRASYSNLKTGGLIAFDVIDANRFIPNIKNELELEHFVEDENKKYYRKSNFTIDYTQSWTFRWVSKYYIQENNTWKEIFVDDSTLRAFTKNEIELFLKIAGFEIVDCFEKESYAFPTLVFVAKKGLYLSP